MIPRRNFLKVVGRSFFAVMAGSLASRNSFAAGERIVFLDVQPRMVGRGTRNTYKFQLLGPTGRPIAGKLVRLWFTGDPNAVGAGFQLTTDANGCVTNTMTAPNFRGSSWLNINAECKSLGVQPTAWRVGY